MALGTVDLDPRFNYIIVYKHKDENTLNTWSLPKGSAELNLKLMMDNQNLEVVGVYKKLSNEETVDLLSKK